MSRGASLSTIMRRALSGETALPPGSAVLVAVSGGPDSMALLELFSRLGPRLGLAVFAHGVDHGLRDEASRELDLAEAWATRHGVQFQRTRVAVPRGGNLQARARQARWRELTRAARERKAAIATAHHADDRAETVLMRLMRGAGVRGLGVLPPRSTVPEAADVSVIRPLLRATRADILAHLARHHVPYAHDPSNEDPRYLRTKVRRRVLPLLAELDPNIVRHLEAIADEIASNPSRQHENLDDGTVARVVSGVDASAAVAGLASPAWATKLPRSTQVALGELLSSRSREARVWLPGGLVVSVEPRASSKREDPQEQTKSKPGARQERPT